MSNYATNLERRTAKFGMLYSVEAIFELHHGPLAIILFCCLRSLWKQGKRSSRMWNERR